MLHVLASVGTCHVRDCGFHATATRPHECNVSQFVAHAPARSCYRIAEALVAMQLALDQANARSLSLSLLLASIGSRMRLEFPCNLRLIR